MHQERENLDILFRRTAPEIVLENIRASGHFIAKCPLAADAANYGREAYEHYASLSLSEYSLDETELRFQYLEKAMQKDGDALIYSTLYEYADKVLVLKGDEPVCRLEKVLGWNSISKRLGQDLFISAWLAWKDTEDPAAFRRKFIWPAVTGTDDRRLDAIFEKGLAENHFHLHGSTQSFALSWACLMNHPEYIGEFFNQNNYFSENLNMSLSKGVLDNQMDWKQKIKYAAMVRVLLFSRCVGVMSEEGVRKEFRKFDYMPFVSKIKPHTESLRRSYGACFEQISHKRICLDYANSSYFYQIEEESANRLLAGERNFLYQCFKRQFSGEFTGRETSLLYLYILIKNQFRSELIQVNKRTGFSNFARYQERKNQFFGGLEEYWTEAQRLSVGAAMEKNHLVSLEARIMPRNTAVQMKNEIAGLDARMRLAIGKDKDLPYYVIHFPKKKFTKKELKNKGSLLLPRNYEIREGAKVKAKALVQYLQMYDREEKRVWGIDACSLEIGCRPEVFATEFRYIRKCGMRKKECFWEEKKESKREKIGVTYHVGEDFLDIIDGLRAIDEAILFLQLEKGDRLGHALALGIAPKEYYESKGREIYLTKQDYLDNLIWMLYRSLELNISIDTNQRAKMQRAARRLLLEIYGCDNTFAKNAAERQPVEMLDMYYASWLLRGDHPDLYKSGGYQKEKSLSLLISGYGQCMAGEKNFEDDREHNIIAGFYYSYHFDKNVKAAGLEPVYFRIEDWYIDLAGAFQSVLRKTVVKKGIAIECNPTSNVLIGTFGAYAKHPILAFNDYCLDELSKNPHIQVSINTDDLGVFDTSLENEYALLLCAICSERRKEGNYNDDAVYEYLDYLRENGVRMAFRQIGAIKKK